MRISHVFIAVAAALCLAVQPAAAQDAGLAQRTALAERLIRATAGPSFTKSLESLIGEQVSAIEAAGTAAGVGRQEAAWIRANAPRMLTTMTNRLLTDLAPHYAEIYTSEELEAQLAFYESPMGRQIAAKSFQLGMATQEVTEDSMIAFVTELQSKYCAQFNCDAAASSASKGRR